jgi:hypothetical protein
MGGVRMKIELGKKKSGWYWFVVFLVLAVVTVLAGVFGYAGRWSPWSQYVFAFLILVDFTVALHGVIKWMNFNLLTPTVSIQAQPPPSPPAAGVNPAPPTIIAFDVVPGSPNYRVEVTFSEVMDPQSITNANFTLRKQDNTQVAANVERDAANRKATLIPDNPLEKGATYVATVMSGDKGPKNRAGTPLAADRSWSFSTPRNLGMWQLFIGQDARGSTSKSQVAVWTFVFVSALLTLLLFYLSKLGDVLVNLQPEYLVLLGSPAAAALLAKKFTGDQIEEGTTVKPQATEQPTLGSALTQTVTTDDGNADLFDFQYVLFTLLTIAYFLATFVPNPAAGLPDLPDTLVALSGLSAASYATKKGLWTDSPPTISAVSPSLLFVGKDNEQITITGTNFGDRDPGVPDASKVLLNGRPLGTLDIVQWNSQQILATVPSNPADLGITSLGGTNPTSLSLEVQDRFGRKSQPATTLQAKVMPTVSVVNPMDKAKGVPVGTPIEATFSEPMNEDSVEAKGAFTLLNQVTTQQVPAEPVGYEQATKKATLKPSDNLESGTTYKATVKGGDNGVKSAAGTPLAADKSWSFETA